MAIEKAPKHGGRVTLTAIGDQAVLYFQQRHVRPPANETVQIVAMGLYTTRTTISPCRSRRDLALGFEARHPAHGAGDADPKTPGCRVARHAAFHHRPHNAFAKIVGKRHPRRLLRTAPIFKQIKADSGIPPHDSIRSETALSGSSSDGVRTRRRSPGWRARQASFSNSVATSAS